MHAKRFRTLLVAAATAAVTVAAPVAAQASTTPALFGSAANPIPAHVYAPYVETYNNDDLATLAQESGAHYETLAFFQTATAGSCTAYWNGVTTTPIAKSTYGSEIAEIQAHGGNVIPSFGGYGADTTNTDIADSCTDVNAIAGVYESLVTTYHVTRIDLDVEADSLNNTAGIQRRNEAVAEAEHWAARHGKQLQFSYTIPTNPTGLTATGLAVLQNAKAEGAQFAIVNGMTFDYYFGTTEEMGSDSVAAATAIEGQLKTLFPHESARELYGQVGVTEMPGIDDFGAAETFTQADATTVLKFAEAHGLGLISIWALDRDNGSCPGLKGQGTCSGVAQPTWYFSHTFEPFTSWTGWYGW
jgi:Glycosyl hydrolases family 18